VKESSGVHILNAFFLDITKGERDYLGVDLEIAQTVTFSVSVSEGVFFKSVPYVHSNGTLVFELVDAVSGIVHLNVSLTDDGGYERKGINVSSIATFDLVISGTLLEVVLSAPAIEDKSAMCDIAIDLGIPCDYVVQKYGGVYHVMAGKVEDLLLIAQRASYLMQVGRGPAPRTANGIVDDSRDSRSLLWMQVNASSPGGGEGWESWMIPAGTLYVTATCSSTMRVAPKCEVQFPGVPAGSLMFLTVDVQHSDFGDTDEYIDSVTAGSQVLGTSFLTSDGSDDECDISSRIIDTAPVDASMLSDAGTLSVRMSTTSTVGFYLCEGQSLTAKVMLIASTLSVTSVKVLRYNLGGGLGSFQIAKPHVTIVGYQYPMSMPLVLKDLVANISEPMHTELDLQGRARLVFHMRPIRFKPYVSAFHWREDGSDGGLLLGFASPTAPNGNISHFNQSHSNASNGTMQGAPWYSCAYCLNQSHDTGDGLGIVIHRKHWHGIPDAQISHLSVSVAQSDLGLNGVVEFEISMSTTSEHAVANFSRRFSVEVVLTIDHQTQFRLMEDDDETTFACALRSSFVTDATSMRAGAAEMAVPYNISTFLLGPGSREQGVDGGGGNFLYNTPQYLSNSMGCWEVELNLIPDRYGIHSYRVHVSVDTLSGMRHVSLEIQIIVAAINDVPSLELSNTHILVEENVFVDWRYLSHQAVLAVTAGPFEPLQNLTFVFSFVSGKHGLFAAEGAPQIDPKTGTLSFLSERWQRGSALYSLHLVDSSSGAHNMSLMHYVSFRVQAVNRAPAFALASAASRGWTFDAMRLESATAGNTTGSKECCNGSILVRESHTAPIIVPSLAIYVVPGLPIDDVESLQALTFHLTLISGNTAMLHEHPVLHANGTLTLRLLPHRHGLLKYNVTLVDNGCGLPQFRSDGCYNGTCDTCASGCLASASTELAYVNCTLGCTCAGECNNTCVKECTVNAANEELSQTTCRQRCKRLANASVTRVTSCLGTNHSQPHNMWVAVYPVNDAPSFSINDPSVHVLETQSSTESQHSLTNFASNIDAGPLESYQLLSFQVLPTLAKVPEVLQKDWSNDTALLFGKALDTPAMNPWAVPQQLFAKATAVKISSEGQLTFELEPYRSGTVHFRILLFDNGGFDLDGHNRSQPSVFSITVTAVNDAPVFELTLPIVHMQEGMHMEVPAFATAVSAGVWGEDWQHLSFTLSQISGPSSLVSINLVCLKHNTSASTARLQAQHADDENKDATCSGGNAWLIINGAPQHFGNVTFNVTLTDVSSSLSGESDSKTSMTHIFSIEVLPVNDAPDFRLRVDELIVFEDSSCFTRPPTPGLPLSYLSRPAGAKLLFIYPYVSCVYIHIYIYTFV